MNTRERVAPTERIAVRCVDSDVHPTPRAGELVQYIPEPWRSKYFLTHKMGEQIYYDAPDYAHAYAMRTDTFPADGEFAGSDPDLAFKQLIMEAGADIAILEPIHGFCRLPEAPLPSAPPTTTWQANHWLDSHNNWHQRWRGSICLAIEEPEDGAARDRALGRASVHGADPDQRRAAPVVGRPEVRPDLGGRHQARHHRQLPPRPQPHEELPIPPVGFPSYNHDFMVTYSLLAANQVMSLIFDGVFDRFPTLRIVFIEHAFTWILPLMWRMDAIYEARKSWMDIKRKPSEYVKDHIKFTTQPLDYPEDKTELTRAFEWMECEKILLFSSDYPHWTFDDPRWLVKHLPEHAREAVMFRNGIATYHLPETVPALEGQTGCSEWRAPWGVR